MKKLIILLFSIYFLLFSTNGFAITTWFCEKDNTTYKFMFDDNHIYVDFGRTTDKYKITEKTDKVLRNERNNGGIYNDIKIYLNEKIFLGGPRLKVMTEF